MTAWKAINFFIWNINMYTYIRQRVITHTDNNGQIKSASVKVARSRESRSFCHAFGTSVQIIAYYALNQHIKDWNMRKNKTNMLNVPTTYSLNVSIVTTIISPVQCTYVYFILWHFKLSENAFAQLCFSCYPSLVYFW